MSVTDADWCPACGPVPPEATSRYCQQHIAQLLDRFYQALGRSPSVPSMPSGDAPVPARRRTRPRAG